MRSGSPVAPHDDADVLTHAELPRFVAESYSTPFMRQHAGESAVHPHGRQGAVRHRPGPAVARHVQQLPRVLGAAGRGHRARACGIHGRDPAPPAVLRPTALRLRHARHRRTAVASDHPDAATLRFAAGVPDRRAGAELRGRVPRRARSTCSPTTTTPADCPSRRCCSREFLERQRYQPPPLPTRERSCTVTATTRPVLGMDAEVALLKRWASTTNVLDSGCCGMAGSFGFDAGNYDVSMRSGRTRAAARSARPRPRHAHRHQRVQLPGADRAEHGPDRRPPRRAPRSGRGRAPRAVRRARSAGVAPSGGGAGASTVCLRDPSVGTSRSPRPSGRSPHSSRL